MASSRTNGPQAHGGPTGSLSIESASSSKLQGLELHAKGNPALYRPLRKASEPAFFKSFFAVIAASLALVYLVFQCIQHSSFYPGPRDAIRSLAAGDFGGDFCIDWSEDGGAGDSPSDENAHQGRVSETGPSPAMTAGAHVQQTLIRGWGHRQIPSKWEGRFRRVLGSVHQIATTALTMLPSLTPEDAVSFSMQLSMVAAVELATYAYISDNLQPLRAEAGRAFIDLLQAVLDMESTRAAARSMGLSSKLYLLQQFHRELGGVPPLTERFRDYRLMMISWWRTGFFTTTQILAHLNALHLEARQNVVPPAKVEAFCQVLDAIFRTRKMQLLGSLTMRHWFVLCQRRIRSFLLFTPDEYEKGRKKRPASSVSPSDKIYHAIVAAGGTVVPVAAPASDLEYLQSAERTQAQSISGPAQSASPVVHLHHSDIPPVPPRVPPPPGFEPLRLPHHPSGPGRATPPLQPQPPASYPLKSSQGPHPPGSRHPALAVQSQQQPLQLGAPSNWEALGARPRRGASATGLALEPGWGHRRMPSYWEKRMKKDLEKMQMAATACVQLLPSVSPQQAVMLSERLAMLAALQLGAFAYLPAALQPLRTAVSDSYSHLIENILAAAPTVQAATHMNKVKALGSLRKLLGIIGSAAPPTEVMLPSKYEVKMVVQHNTCSFAYRQILELLKNLLLAQRSPEALDTQLEVALKALHNIYTVLKMQLLGDVVLRYPILNAHKGHKGFGLYQREDLVKAGRAKKPRLKQVLEKLQQAVREAGGIPLALDKGQTSVASGPGQAQSFELLHVAAQPIAGPPRQQKSQQIRSMRPPPQVAPPPGFRPLTYQAPAESIKSTQASPKFPGLPPQLTRHPAPRYKAPTPFGQPQHPHLASPWASSFLEGLQTPSGQQHHGSRGKGESELGLHDLALRISKLDISDSEDEEDMRGQ
ncbi:hypothetical protein Emag_000511 [Eimeria magna]